MYLIFSRLGCGHQCDDFQPRSSSAVHNMCMFLLVPSTIYISAVTNLAAGNTLNYFFSCVVREIV